MRSATPATLATIILELAGILKGTELRSVERSDDRVPGRALERSEPDCDAREEGGEGRGAHEPVFVEWCTVG